MNSHNAISIDKDISCALTMPAKFYTEKKYFNRIINNVFPRSWQFISDKSILKNNIHPFIFLKDTINEPLILTSYNNSVNILSNVCTHRGSILCDKNTNSSNIKCEYHGRLFDLKGEFISAPGFKNVKNFPSNNDNLNIYHIKFWKNLIFCSLNNPINIDDILIDIENRLKGYPLLDLQYNSTKSETYYLKAHWALYCENYLEGLHIPFIHKGLNNEINLNSYKTIFFENGVLQYAMGKGENNSISSKENIYACYYWIYPNIMLNFYSWGLSINIIEPIDLYNTRIKFISFPIKGLSQVEKSDSSITEVEKEDQNIILKVQKGIASTSYQRGRYSTEHEKGVHYFHRLLAENLN